MSTAKKSPPSKRTVPSELATCLGVRRTMTLRRIMRQSGLPLEVLLDLALEMLDIASRKLSPIANETPGRWPRRRAVAECRTRGTK